MESAVTPRDIQTRIRAGESVDEVARAADMPIDLVQRFAEPVLAEREHLAELARGCPVRRQIGEVGSRRPLIDVIGDRLTVRGIYPDSLAWDAWRGRDRLWTVRVAYELGSAPHEGLFTFDPRGRFSVPANDEARWLLGDGTGASPTPRKRRATSPDEEPTLDLHRDTAPTRASTLPLLDDLRFDDFAVLAIAEPAPVDLAVMGGPMPDLPDFSPAQLAEVDGIYDIVPAPPSDLDVLYDMLSGLDEDSVKLYADITGHRPVPVPPPRVAVRPAPAPAPPVRPVPASAPPVRPAPVSAPPVRRTPAPAAPVRPAPPDPAPVAPTVEAAPGAADSPPPARKSRKRAVVPSAWDDILFGSRKPDET